MAKKTINKKSVVVIGDGWAALGAVAQFAREGCRVHWVTATGARMFAPLPTLEVAIGESAVQGWKRLAEDLGIQVGEAQPGVYLREFRNKAFRQPAWVSSPEIEQKRETRNEMLWGPELSLTSLTEARFELTLGELEEQIRSLILSKDEWDIERIDGNPVSEIQVQRKKATAVILGSGQEIQAEEIVYADRWNELPLIKGLPKALGFTHRRDPVGVLQACFTHSASIATGVNEGFYATLHKESGDAVERHVLGYFSSDGLRSFWTICLSTEEAEDNHEIAKKLRRMKSALAKVFSGPTWVPEGVEDFLGTVSSENGEQVRFEEGVVFGAGEPISKPVSMPALQGMWFLTDGYGPSYAMMQVEALLEERARVAGEAQAEAAPGLEGDVASGPDAEAKSPDLSSA